MMQLAHSLFGDNSVVPIHLWWRETVLKRKKEHKYFPDILLNVSNKIGKGRIGY